MNWWGKTALITTAVLIATVFNMRAHAGVYTDSLTKCIVGSTTKADRLELAKWMFFAMASHPALASFASISKGQRQDADKKMAAIVTRLLTKSCRRQARNAMEYEGASALGASFRVLGQVAARELFMNPCVATNMKGFTKDLNKSKLNAALGVK